MNDFAKEDGKSKGQSRAYLGQDGVGGHSGSTPNNLGDLERPESTTDRDRLSVGDPNIEIESEAIDLSTLPVDYSTELQRGPRVFERKLDVSRFDSFMLDEIIERIVSGIHPKPVAQLMQAGDALSDNEVSVVFRTTSPIVLSSVFRVEAPRHIRTIIDRWTDGILDRFIPDSLELEAVHAKVTSR